jgi:MYXO-CTERM domain-containing protein
MGGERRTLDMIRRLIVLTTFVALGVPAAALAKEPVKATVCGANGCASSTDKAAILPLVEGGPPAAKQPTAGAPAYRVRLTISVDDGSRAQHRKTDTFTNWMSPTLRLVRGSEGTWMTMTAPTLAALRDVAREIRPFPAARVPLGGRVAGTGGDALPPQTYAPALERNLAPAPSTDTDWALIGGIVGGMFAALIALAGAVVRRRRARPTTHTAAVP